jgi:ABC-type phosphate/phosphonate transport system ATPase subunit
MRRQICIIFQQFNLVGRMDVLSNVLTGLLPRASPTTTKACNLENEHDKLVKSNKSQR